MVGVLGCRRKTVVFPAGAVRRDGRVASMGMNVAGHNVGDAYESPVNDYILTALVEGRRVMLGGMHALQAEVYQLRADLTALDAREPKLRRNMNNRVDMALRYHRYQWVGPAGRCRGQGGGVGGGESPCVSMTCSKARNEHLLTKNI